MFWSYAVLFLWLVIFYIIKAWYFFLSNIWLAHLLALTPFQIDMLHALWILDINKIRNFFLGFQLW